MLSVEFALLLRDYRADFSEAAIGLIMQEGIGIAVGNVGGSVGLGIRTREMAGDIDHKCSC